MQKRMLLEMTVIYNTLIKIFVNLFSCQATTSVLPSVKMEYGDQQWFKF